ncbi:hypothetical protein CN321_03175 [Bacillus thuringiensis]|nr:hypothetical protein CN321_03175 [Bacillus thuringiensis]
MPYLFLYLSKSFPQELNNLKFFIYSSQLNLTKGLEVFYHVETFKENGWKADLSPTLIGHKKVINQNRWISVLFSPCGHL